MRSRTIEAQTILQTFQKIHGGIPWMGKFKGEFVFQHSENIGMIISDLCCVFDTLDFRKLLEPLTPDCYEVVFIHDGHGEVIFLGETFGSSATMSMIFPDNKTAEIIRESLITYCHDLRKGDKSEVMC